MERAVVDFQGFKDNENNFIIKELAIQKFNFLEEINKMNHYLFLPPFNFNDLPFNQRKQTFWNQFNHHGFRWSDGIVKYNIIHELFYNLAETCNIIYVKGIEEEMILNKIFKKKLYMKIVNLEYLGCNNLINLKKNMKELIIDCVYNHNNSYCAINNVRILTKWIIKFWNENCNNHNLSKTKLRKNCFKCLMGY